MLPARDGLLLDANTLCELSLRELSFLSSSTEPLRETQHGMTPYT